jgi:Flp pilus assembly protein TadD
VTAPRTCWRASLELFVPSLVWVLITGTVFSGFPLPWSVFAATKPNPQKNAVAERSTARVASDNYVGSSPCAQCHADIYESFQRTRMGRSIVVATPALLGNLKVPASLFNQGLDRHFAVFERQGSLFESEFQIAPNGEDVFRNSQEVKWVVGAGANGYSALIQRGQYLFEAPLSYFTKLGEWQPSPGYETSDNGFNRPVLAGCISCHSGRANPADEMTGKFEAAPFSQMAIGCENCHGPGGSHVRAMTANDTRHGTRIVNPRKLSSDLENDICMSCHEAGNARVLRPGKTYQDFRPGTPLDNTWSILSVPLQRSDPDNKDHVQHYLEMSMSRCFRASSGQLRCATCHDPHEEPTLEEAPAYFNGKCVSCHASRACKLPIESRRKTSPADNCIGCHMPQRAATETAHTSLTNHRILAQPGEPWPDEAFEQTTRALPDLVHINRVAGTEDELPSLTLLEAYREIAERRPEYKEAYEKTLAGLEQSDPDVFPVQLALGKRDLANGETQNAIHHLQRATALDPKQASGYAALAQALAQADQIDQAIAASQKAVSLEPYNALSQKALIDQLIAAKRYDKATAAMEHYLELFPEDGFMRRMLEIAKQ